MQYGQILLRAFNQNNKKGFKNGKGKFRKTKQNVDELAKVVKSTIVNATSYQRVGTLTKVVGVVRNQGKNACTAETISALVPDRLVPQYIKGGCDANNFERSVRRNKKRNGRLLGVSIKCFETYSSRVLEEFNSK